MSKIPIGTEVRIKWTKGLRTNVKEQLVELELVGKHGRIHSYPDVVGTYAVAVEGSLYMLPAGCLEVADLPETPIQLLERAYKLLSEQNVIAHQIGNAMVKVQEAIFWLKDIPPIALNEAIEPTTTFNSKYRNVGAEP